MVDPLGSWAKTSLLRSAPAAVEGSPPLPGKIFKTSAFRTMDKLHQLVADLVDLVEEADLSARELNELPYCASDFNECSDRVNDAAIELRFALETFLGKKLERTLAEDIELAIR